MASSAASSSWTDLLGPCLTGRAAAELLGITLAELSRRRRRGHVLGVMTRSRRWVYPTVQFETNERGVTASSAQLEPVLASLLGAADGLGAARWMATPNTLLSGHTPWEALHDDPDRVLAAAERQANAWTGGS
jgi:hypothetical protein